MYESQGPSKLVANSRRVSLSNIANRATWIVALALLRDPEDELVRVQLDEAQKKKRHGWKRWVMIGVSVAVIALTFAFVLPKIADYAQVWDVVKGLSWVWIVALLAAAGLNVATCA